MKQNSTSILGRAVIAAVASVFCFAINAGAQMNTSTSDNPNLRKRMEPAKAPTTKVSDKDKEFLRLAANSGVGAVADGKQAQQLGQSTDVKKIGARVVADRSKSNTELQALAKKKGLGMEMSSGKPRNFPKDTFDHQYLYNLEEDHKADIKTFEKEAASGDDADVKAWAAKMLPTLKTHLALVKDARKKVK